MLNDRLQTTQLATAPSPQNTLFVIHVKALYNTKTNPNPNRYRSTPDPNARIQKFIRYRTS